MDELAIIAAPPQPEDTSFKACFERFADDYRLPAASDAPLHVVRFGIVDFRRLVAMHFFSCGLVHAERMRSRLEEILPATPPEKFQHRLPGVPEGFGSARKR